VDTRLLICPQSECNINLQVYDGKGRHSETSQ
jgi:hypothetical protein